MTGLRATGGSDLTATGMPSERERVKSEWHRWLAGVFEDAKTELVTLTFADAPWDDSRRGPTLSRVKRAVARFEEALTTAPGRPSYFGVIEQGAWSSRRHIHVVVTAPTQEAWWLRQTLAQHRFLEGRIDVRPVSSIGGVSGYVTKYVVKSGEPEWFAGGPLWLAGAAASTVAGVVAGVALERG